MTIGCLSKKNVIMVQWSMLYNSFVKIAEPVLQMPGKTVYTYDFNSYEVYPYLCYLML